MDTWYCRQLAIRSTSGKLYRRDLKLVLLYGAKLQKYGQHFKHQNSQTSIRIVAYFQNLLCTVNYAKIQQRNICHSPVRVILQTCIINNQYIIIIHKRYIALHVLHCIAQHRTTVHSNVLHCIACVDQHSIGLLCNTTQTGNIHYLRTNITTI